jgi:uncharacterized protein YndB with AHSA1/START domain
MSELGEITPCWTVTFKRRLKHPPPRVWAAITDPAEASKWMTYPTRIDLRVGGHWNAYFEGASEPWLPGVIIRVEPERRLAYVWGYSVVEWLLEPDGVGTSYTFVVHGNQQPPAGADWTPEGTAAGWHGGVDLFEAYLDAVPLPRAQLTSREREITPLYRQRIEAVMKSASR